MPKLDGILETCIHTDDMARAKAFYEGVLELEPIYSDNRLTAYSVAGRDVLLVFRKGATGDDHGACRAAASFPAMAAMARCMSPSPSARINWRNGRSRLAARGVAIEGAHTWTRGGRSIYFRDPDGHLLELATPGLWSVY